MRAAYWDIQSRVSAKPLWWDCSGVPRYDVFTPEDVPDIYANEAALVG